MMEEKEKKDLELGKISEEELDEIVEDIGRKGKKWLKKFV